MLRFLAPLQDSHVETIAKDDWKSAFAPDVVAEAEELARGAEILPDVRSLAQRIAESRKSGQPMRVKLGIDPTSTDLHVGHAVVFRKLRRFQDFGHQVVLIIGGFTATIGDPTGRTETRKQLTSEQVMVNAKTYIDQMGLILDVSKTELVNNADWLGPMTLNDWIELAAKVTVNQLLAKESFGQRIDNHLPVSLHELFYPLLQGYDSIAIKSDVELGGTDQRFNILQGRELQPHFNLKPQLACLLPLLEGTDGVQKMSKSFNNYIGLKENPTDMFGKCMRIPDNMIVKYFELATTFPGAEIDAIAADIKGGANPMTYKEKLGHQIVSQYHGKDAADKALDEWKRVHSERQVPDEMPSYVVKEATPLFRLLVDSGMAGGSGEAKRLVADKAVRIDGETQTNHDAKIEVAGGQSLVLQVGRRKFMRLTNG